MAGVEVALSICTYCPRCLARAIACILSVTFPICGNYILRPLLYLGSIRHVVRPANAFFPWRSIVNFAHQKLQPQPLAEIDSVLKPPS